MKNTRIRLGAGLLFALLTQQSFSQDIIKISPELSQKVAARIKPFKIYRVVNKEVEYRAYDTAQVLTQEYKDAQIQMSGLKYAYNKYVEKLNITNEKREALVTIVSKIDAFLDSNEKYEVKEKYLIEAQDLSDKYHIDVITNEPEGGLKGLLSTNTSGYGVQSKRTIKLYEAGKKTSKGDLKIYRDFVKKIPVSDPEKPYQYQQYLDAAENLSHIKKTETGQVISDKPTKKMAYAIDGDPIDISQLSGEFKTFGKDYMLVLEDVPGLYAKNEVIRPLSLPGSAKVSASYDLIQKNDTNEIYFIMSRNFLGELSYAQEDQKLLDLVHTLGYTEHTIEGANYIKSKTSEIMLTPNLYDNLMKDSSWITKFDNAQVQISALVAQTPPHTKLLDKYIGIYNIQRNHMSAQNIAAWRRATANAQKLFNQIYALSEKYNNGMAPEDKTHSYEMFLDNLNASKGVLGM